MAFECPKCSEKLLSEHMDSGRWLIACSKCGICFATDETNLSLEKSIEILKTEYNQGDLNKKGFSRVKKHGLEFKLRLLRSGFMNKNEFNELPLAVKGILRGGDEVVKYEFMKAINPERGSNIDDTDLKYTLRESLKEQGIKRLYKFQEEAIREISRGENVVISAPTASGKTEGFILPIYQNIINENIKSTGIQALLIYPTKTLSRDQLKKLRKLGNKSGIKVDVYDGDTLWEERARIEEDPPEILITNFDMIHYHLQYGDTFYKLIRTARWVVIDEIHQYTGAFGSNVHFILERMRRTFKNNFQVIGASATIKNPKEFSEILFETPVKVIKCNDGKHGPIHFTMLYPNDRSSKTMLADILRKTLKSDMKTLVFGNSHKSVESLSMIARNREGINIEVHRAGLSYSHRRKVERRLRNGELKAVAATPTLELGVDIGDLDAVVSELVGITPFKQRIGRVARRGQEGLAVLGLRNNDPISSYYRNHPDDYFTDIDPGYCEPSNPVVAKHQLIAASIDKPIKNGEFQDYNDVLRTLEKDELLHKDGKLLKPTKSGYKKIKNYSIRGIGTSISILYNGRKIGYRQMPLAARELHPGAIYLHAGREYISKSFKFDNKSGMAKIEKSVSNSRIRTNSRRQTNPEILKILDRRNIYGIEVLYCKLRMTEIVDGYYKIDLFKDKVIGEYPLENEIKYSFKTMGIAFKAPEINIKNTTDPEDIKEKLRGTYHAMEHAIIETSDMLTGGGSKEIGGVAMGTSGVIFAYDGSPGGTGVSKLLYDRFKDALKRSYNILRECRCNSENGCPACIQSYQCGSNNNTLNRAGAIRSLSKILDGKETKVSKGFDKYKAIV